MKSPLNRVRLLPWMLLAALGVFVVALYLLFQSVFLDARRIGDIYIECKRHCLEAGYPDYEMAKGCFCVRDGKAVRVD